MPDIGQRPGHESGEEGQCRRDADPIAEIHGWLLSMRSRSERVLRARLPADAAGELRRKAEGPSLPPTILDREVDVHHLHAEPRPPRLEHRPGAYGRGFVAIMQARRRRPGKHALRPGGQAVHVALVLRQRPRGEV